MDYSNLYKCATTGVIVSLNDLTPEKRNKTMLKKKQKLEPKRHRLCDALGKYQHARTPDEHKLIEEAAWAFLNSVNKTIEHMEWSSD